MILFGHFGEKRKLTPYRFRKFSFFYYDSTKKISFRDFVPSRQSKQVCSALDLHKVPPHGFPMRRKLLLQVTYYLLLTRINPLLRKGGKGLSGRDALDDAFIVTDNNILSTEGFFLKHPTLCKIKPFLYLLTKFQYFFLRHMISFV